MNLETKYAAMIVRMLEDAQDAGFQYVVFGLAHMERELQPYQLVFFDTLGAALDYWGDRAGLGYSLGGENPIYYRSVEQMLGELKQANHLINQNIQTMNRNNLENLREEMQTLRFDEKLILQMEEKMKMGLPEFQLRDVVPGKKGNIDLLLHFKKSGQSEHYYLNRFDTTLNRAKPLEEGQKYLVISQPEGVDKPLVRKFDVPHEAIAFFKEVKGNSELAVGKDIRSKSTLATIENGQLNYVVKDFSKVFHAPVVSQSFYPDKGRGFTAEQAANMIEGRSVFRADMINQGGVPYQAWIKLDMDSAKDRSMNFTLNQYHVPSYGFDLEKTLEKYNIKELNNAETKAQLIGALEHGNRPIISSEKDGEEIKLHVEAVPRYSQVNFYQENGKPEKREQFLKEPVLDKAMNAGKTKGKEAEVGQGMEV
jgi:hypothetical protein